MSIWHEMRLHAFSHNDKPRVSNKGKISGFCQPQKVDWTQWTESSFWNMGRCIDLIFWEIYCWHFRSWQKYSHFEFTEQFKSRFLPRLLIIGPFWVSLCCFRLSHSDIGIVTLLLVILCANFIGPFPDQSVVQRVLNSYTFMSSFLLILNWISTTGRQINSCTLDQGVLGLTSQIFFKSPEAALAIFCQKCLTF